MIPVLLWSFTSVGLGTGLSIWERGTFDPWSLVVAMALAGLVQGWVTHAINEIYDWRSGTDRDEKPRALSGGSKVQNLSLLQERDLWTVFGAASVGVAVLSAYVALSRPFWLLLLVGAGYILGVAYTLPPVATAYRPYVGEWLGGFPGVLLAGLGAYGIQALTLSWVVVAALSAHALVCTAMLVMHHYVDAPADATASPPKRTTAVSLGLPRARIYATALAAAAALIYGLLVLLVQPAFALGALFTLPAVGAHARVRPWDLVSVTRNELRVIQLGIAAGLSTAVALAPALWPLVPIAAVAYAVHLVVAAPPPDLARAWLPAKRRAKDASSAGPLSEM
jgi:1,4-dihydroxy-2-naphthoate octaprenyltransferase